MIRTTLVPQHLRLGAWIVEVKTYETWRNAARAFVARRVEPDQVQWLDRSGECQLLLGIEAGVAVDGIQPQPDDRRRQTGRVSRCVPPPRCEQVIRVPKQFTELARLVACHRDGQRWDLLYRVLWRLTHGERSLLHAAADRDVRSLAQWASEVRADLESMKKGIRFQPIGDGPRGRYLAWYQPAHRTLELLVPFLRRRFGIMQWSVFTPDASVQWDGEQLTWGAGAIRPPDCSPTNANQSIQSWWSQVGSSLVTGHGEHQLIDATVRGTDMGEPMSNALGRNRLAAMRLPGATREAARRPPHGTIISHSAEDYLPDNIADLAALGRAAFHCAGCSLCEGATQTVFGHGPASARLVMVGQQPDGVEDRCGRPFTGPAGRLLDEVLEEAGIDRSQVYLTNVVKHFKRAAQGARRWGAKPTAREVAACFPWLEAELSAIKPEVLVCLGATASSALLGPGHRVVREHGQVFSTPWAPRTIVTWHPLAILRAIAGGHGDDLRRQFAADLQKVAELLRG